MPGAAFGRYVIERKLGQGGMGAVYLARDSALDRLVALKIPKLEAGDTEGRQRFLREARTAAALSHSNICPIHDVSEFNGTPYLTMLYIEGRPLSDYCNPAKPVLPRSAAILIRKLALALSEAHLAGVIHRDLKPENVMVDRKGEPVVMDFGLARSFQQAGAGRVTQSGVICGSPAYMSPEQISDDQAAIGPASDIYSLGVILYELVTGKLPFDGSVGRIFARVLTEPPPRPREVRPEIDAHLESICLRMLAKTPGQRYGSMREVAAAVTGYLSLPQPEAAPSATVETAAVAASPAPVPAYSPTLISLDEVPSASARRASPPKLSHQRILVISTASVVGLIVVSAAAWMLNGSGAARPNAEGMTERPSAKTASVAKERIAVTEKSADTTSTRRPPTLARLEPLESSSPTPEAATPATLVPTTPPPSPPPSIASPSPSTPAPTAPAAPLRKTPQIYVDLPKLPRPGDAIAPEKVVFDPTPDLAARFRSGLSGRWSLVLPKDFDRKIVVVDEPGASTDADHPHRIRFKLTKPFDAEQQPRSPPPDVIAECLLGDAELSWTWALTKDLDVRGIQNSLRQCVLSREDGSNAEPVRIALQQAVSISGPISLAAVLSKPDNRLTLARHDRTGLFAPLAGTGSLALKPSGGEPLDASFGDNALRIDCPSLASQGGFKRFVFVVTPTIDQVYVRVETDPSVADAAEQLAGAKKARFSLTTRLNRAQAQLGNARSSYAAAEQMSARNNAEQTLRNSKLGIAAQLIARSETELAKALSLVPGADNLLAQRQSEHDDLQRRCRPINDTELTGDICRMVGDIQVTTLKLGGAKAGASP